MLYVSESLIGIAKSKKCAQIDMWHVHFRLNVSLHYLSNLSWQVYWYPKYRIAESSIFFHHLYIPITVSRTYHLCWPVDQELKWDSAMSFQTLWGCPEVTLGPSLLRFRLHISLTEMPRRSHNIQGKVQRGSPQWMGKPLPKISDSVDQKLEKAISRTPLEAASFRTNISQQAISSGDL